MRPFNNKTNFDPGRFVLSISFYQQGSIKTPSGGSKLRTTYIDTYKAGELPLNSNGQVEIIAGATVTNDDRNFLIRASKDFKPKKDMYVKLDENYYVIAAVKPIDVPVKYYQLLCLRKKDYANWLETIE